MTRNYIFNIYSYLVIFVAIFSHFNASSTNLPVKNISIKINELKESKKITDDFAILIYDETSEFTHPSREDARIMFEELGDENGFEVSYDRSGDAFNTLENLQKFAVVVFSNTSGNEILNEVQKENFEAYIKSGGSFLGIHAASDTYRSGWDWYRDLVGASVRTDPHHTDQNFPGVLDVLDLLHPATTELPNPWSRNEEWYYWKGGGGYLYSGNINLLQLRSTGNNDYDEARPISWYKFYDGGRSFYTAMGHDKSAYSEINFRNHILGALQWLTGPQPPSLDPISNISSLQKNAAPQSIELTGISAGTGKAENLIITASSSNPALIPHPTISFEPPSSTATLAFQPAADMTGTAEITLMIDNGEDNDNENLQTFFITVIEGNQPLEISKIEDQAINLDETLEPIQFFIYYEGEDEIAISKSSDNLEIIPEENIVIEGDAFEKTIEITPLPGKSGTANITITATAGPFTTEQNFKVEVNNVTATLQRREKDLYIYPNPAENEFYISLEEGFYNISLYNHSGKSIINNLECRTIKKEPVLIPLEGLLPGLYILTINKVNSTSKHKLIIR
ncbi:MAG: ThuA domain-containing protein [Bacteroidota bacterium]|nr:ThuA domain-containing protein [Bacteroidota bacterium]